MLEYIETKDLVIAPNSIKKQILKELTLSKKILNIKIMTLEEFKKNYFKTANEQSLYYLMKNYNLEYDIAKEYLTNIHLAHPLIIPFYEELMNKKLLVENKEFKKNLNNIKVIGYHSLDKYIVDELKKYNVMFIDAPVNSYKPVVYEFDNETDEIIFVINKIIDDIKRVDINDIYLVNLDEDYKRSIKKLFKMFNIRVVTSNSSKIYSTKIVQTFLNKLYETKDISKSLEGLEESDVYNKIIDILNKYAFVKEIDQAFLAIIKNELKNATIPVSEIKNAVKVIDIEEMTDISKHYYILGFNQGKLPKIYQDNKIIKDKDAGMLGLNTSEEKTKLEKQHLINILKTFSNITITYKLKDNYNTYYPSPLINELDLSVEKNPIKNLNHSNIYNRLLLSEMLDDYINYNKVGENLSSLVTTYADHDYASYNNKYTGIDNEKLYNYLKGELNLSYTSMNNYFLCPFRFYIQNILRLDPFKESFAANLGTVFHECLSHMYDDDFNLEETYSNALKEFDFNDKEKYFIDKLYSVLKFDIENILKQEKYSKFNKALTEKKIVITKENKYKVKFSGVLDKIKVLDNYVAIIDYKTGTIETNLDNINYGIHLQLPVYAYLVKKGLDDKSRIAGFYLQKLLDQIKIDSDDPENEKLKNLYLNGYTNSDLNILEKFDSSYDNSKMIKSLKTTQKGFDHYSKMINDDDIDKVINLVDKKIDEVIQKVNEASFVIAPIRIDDKLIGCEFCKFKDLCFKKEENIKNVKGVKFEDIIKE